MAIAALLVLGSQGRARAYEEQWSLDGALGYALLAGDEHATVQGTGVDLGASFGVSDSVILRGTLGYAFLTDGDRHEHLGRLRAEGLYLLDVLKVVPFFGVGATLTTEADRQANNPVRPGVHLVLGLDYLLSRTWNLGLDVRSGVLFVPGSLLNATDVSLRVSRLFELF